MVAQRTFRRADEVPRTSARSVGGSLYAQPMAVDWTVFAVAAATLVWTVVSFFLNRRHRRQMSTTELNQNASVKSREQFTTKLQYAIGLCLAESDESKQVGLILLSDLMIDRAARDSDRELAGRVGENARQSIQRQISEGEDNV